MNIGIEPIPFPSDVLPETAPMSSFNNMSTKNDTTFTLPSGGERGRTDDLLNANQALQPTELRPQVFFVVPGRVELPTSTLSVQRSNQLSYETVMIY